MDKHPYIPNEEHLHRILKKLHADHEIRLAAIVDCAVRQAIADVAPAIQRCPPSDISCSSTPNHIPGPSLDHSFQPTLPSSVPPSLATASTGVTTNDIATDAASKLEVDEQKPREGTREGTVKLSIEESVKNVNRRLSVVTHIAREESMIKLQEGGFRHTMSKFAMSPMMDYLVAVFIFANAILIAAQTELAARMLEDEPPPVFRVLDLFFTTFFAIELSLRIYVEQKLFVTGHNKGWNCFDTLVVSSALLEEFLKTSNSTTAIRVLRIMRLVRVIRVIRTLRIFKDLRAMVKGVINSLLSLVWAIALLSVICFITSIFITQVVTTHRIQNRDGTTPDDIDYEELDKIFGSLASTMYSLYKAITGGDDWSRFADPLFRLSRVMGLFFCLYVSFGVFAVLNVVTGVFVDNAIKVNQQDADNIIMEQNDQRKKHIDEMKCVFKKADVDESGMLNLAEFQKHLEDPCVQAYFRQLELDVEGQGAETVFSLLDFDGDGTIDAEEFIFGCGQLKGYARSVDVARLNHGQRKMSERLLSLVAQQNERLDSLQHIFCSIVTQLGAMQHNFRKPEQKFAKLPSSLENTARAALDHHQHVYHTDPVVNLPGSVGDRALDASSCNPGIAGFQDAALLR